MERSELDALREELRTTGRRGDRYWAAELLWCAHSAGRIIGRGEALFFDEDNPVEIAAARRHISDLNTITDRLSSTFKETHPEVPWVELERAGDTAAHRDDTMSRDLVWKFLAEDLPTIIQSLGTFLDE